MVVLSAGCLLGLAQPVSADGGIIILGPRTASVGEYVQAAIVAWNGTEEVLILSVDIGASEPTPVLHVVPLPANPGKIEQGSLDSFYTLQGVAGRKTRPFSFSAWSGGHMGGHDSVEVTFHETIGVHDVTVVEVSDLDGFSGWVRDFSTDMGLEVPAVRPEFEATVANYLERDIRFFVFDVIDVTGEQRSIEPLVYRFESDSLYYPFEITSTSDVGSTFSHVGLFLLTEGIVEGGALEAVGLEHLDYTTFLTGEELESVSAELAGFFEADALYTWAGQRGALEELDKDLVVSQDGIHPAGRLAGYLWEHPGLFASAYLMQGGSRTRALLTIGAFMLLAGTVVAFPIKKLLKRFVVRRSRYYTAAYLLSLALLVASLMLASARLCPFVQSGVYVLAFMVFLYPRFVLD